MGTVHRFVTGERPNIRIDTVDRLCAYFGLELTPGKATATKGGHGPHPAAGKSAAGETAGKRRRNGAGIAVKQRANKAGASVGRGRSRGRGTAGGGPNAARP